MSKRSHFISLRARSAPLSTVLLLGALACSSTDEPGIGSAGSGNTSAGSGNGIAGASNASAGSGNGIAGSSSASAGSGNGGSANGSAGTVATGGAGAADSGTGGSSAGADGNNAGSGGDLNLAGASHGGMGGGAGAGSAGAAGGGAADCSALKLCDGFEGDAPGKGASPWMAPGGSALEVTTEQHHNGTHSVHITAPNTKGFASVITEKKTFPASDFWGRAFLRFKGDGGGHQMYIAVNFSGDQLRLLNRLGSDNAQVNFQKSDKFYNTNFKIPMETWFCYEWHVTTSAVSIVVDGKAQMTMNAIPGITDGTSLSLGYTRYAASSAAGAGAGELWIDDVAVSDKQIGCQ